MSHIPAPPNRGSFGNKTEFYKLTPGKHTMRLVGDVVMRQVHYIGKVSFECIEEGCPACERNQEILSKFENNWQKAKSGDTRFSPPSTRYFVNVISRNPVKVHPESDGFENVPVAYGPNGEIYWPPVCTKTTKPLADVPVTMSNKLAVLSGSPALFYRNGQHAQAVTFNSLFEKFGGSIPCDVRITVVQRENSSIKDFILEALPEQNEPVEVTQDLFDLENITIQLSASEIVDVMNGVSLKDIFAARKATEEGVPFVPDVSPEVKQELVTTAQSLANGLFGN